MTQRFPQGETGVRDNRRQHTDNRIQRFLHQCAILLCFLRCALQFIEQFHNRRDGGVELLTAAGVIADFGNGFVQRTAQIFLFRCQAADIQRCGFAFLNMLIHQTPYTADKAVRAFHAGFLPLQGQFRWCRKHHKQTNGIRAVFFHHNLRINAVVLRF